MTRRYSKISGIHVVTCDWFYDTRYPGEAKGCLEEFRSASIERVIPKQLEAAQWKTREIGNREGGKVSQDLCPMHAERAGLGKRRMPGVRRDGEPNDPVPPPDLDQPDLPMPGLLDSGSMHKSGG